ncbi:alpha/beta fold hydrolase [Undibacter mobilis]|uniref:Alpha/beta hydrolase n=1 Tax=Undibacter mobilis TaxID=2292256 RepID=A0A371BBY6_9BRAD|nr:alpha/beta hydrolase [Undibacter mobilis]RDV04933.1 alpha/beta hydrolase [Undibacter mobilis]
MPELPDLYPRFATHTADTSAGRIFARVGGDGPPLLLLHGYPQTHAMWHRVAPDLAEHFTLVIADLPGYGASATPEPDDHHAPYDKRSMARGMVELMQTLGHERFCLSGHDRGGRVAYRLTLDHPAVVDRLATLDIMPTAEMWSAMDAKLALKTYHWMFLAQPAPLPEKLIANEPDLYLERTLASWTLAKDLSAFDPAALDHYRTSASQPARIRAFCEDYRAGATTDLAHDEADRAASRTIDCPMLALWGSGGFPGQTSGPLDVWRRWATKVDGRAIKSGHFLPEENPVETADALIAFFRA